MFFLAVEEFYLCELLVRYAQYPDMSVGGQDGFDSLDVDSGIVHRGAMAYVDGKLKHGESIAHDVFSKFGGSLSIFFCFCGQIVED